MDPDWIENPTQFDRQYSWMFAAQERHRRAERLRKINLAVILLLAAVLVVAFVLV